MQLDLSVLKFYILLLLPLVSRPAGLLVNLNKLLMSE